MKNLIKIAIVSTMFGLMAVGVFAQQAVSTTVAPVKQTWAQRFSLHVPHAKYQVSVPGQVTAQSQTQSFDSSLLSLSYYFDRQPSGSLGGNYQMLAIDVPDLPNPLEIGTVVSSSGTKTLWSGLSVSYNLIKNSQLSFSASLGFPGLTLDNDVLSTAITKKLVVYPGFYLSYKL